MIPLLAQLPLLHSCAALALATALFAAIQDPGGWEGRFLDAYHVAKVGAVTPYLRQLKTTRRERIDHTWPLLSYTDLYPERQVQEEKGSGEAGEIVDRMHSILSSCTPSRGIPILFLPHTPPPLSLPYLLWQVQGSPATDRKHFCDKHSQNGHGQITVCSTVVNGCARQPNPR